MLKVLVLYISTHLWEKGCVSFVLNLSHRRYSSSVVFKEYFLFCHLCFLSPACLLYVRELLAHATGS